MKHRNDLKILFLPTWYPTEAKPVEGTFIKEHAKAASLFHNVTVLHSEGADRTIKGLCNIKSDRLEDGIRTIRFTNRYMPVAKISYCIYLWSLFVVFRKLLYEGWKPDIIHAHVYLSGIPAVILGKIYNIPVIITEHWTAFVLKSLTRLNIFEVRFAMNRAECILPVSKELANAIKWYGVKTKFEIVPNVLDTNMFSIGSKKHRDDVKKILLVSVMSPQKGIPYLLEALKRIYNKRRDFILDVVGDGPNKKEYEELVEKLGIRTIVNFHGMKAKQEVAEFMKGCDFFVQPSLYETFGVTYIEAMACGKPVVASDLAVLRDKINAHRGILVPPGDVTSLERAIDYMIDHYQDFSPKVISEYVQMNFSYESIGRTLHSIYNKYINEYYKTD